MPILNVSESVMSSKTVIQNIVIFPPYEQYSEGGRLVRQCTDLGGGHNPVW